MQLVGGCWTFSPDSQEYNILSTLPFFGIQQTLIKEKRDAQPSDTVVGFERHPGVCKDNHVQL